MSQPVNPAEALAWEDTHRRTAVAGAIVAGVAVVVGIVLQTAALHGLPHVHLLTAMQRIHTIERTDLRVPAVRFTDHRAASLLFLQVVLGAGYATATLAFGYLYRATRARWAPAPRWGLAILLVGLVLLAIGPLIGQVFETIKAHQFLSGSNHGHDAANNVHGAIEVAGQAAGELGNLLAAGGIVMLALNAGRCGLLTRGARTFGVITGVVFIFPTPTRNLLLCAFLLAIAAAISGRWPGGALEAWTTGESKPWPSAVAVRQEREAELKDRKQTRASRRGAGGDMDDDAPPVAPAGAATSAPSPATSKRKRKRRS